MQVPVGGRDHAHVGSHWARATQAHELTLLQHAQELRLSGGGHLGDFVEKQHTARRQLNLTGLGLLRAGEGAALESEQLRFELRGRSSLRWQRRARRASAPPARRPMRRTRLPPHRRRRSARCYVSQRASWTRSRAPVSCEVEGPGDRLLHVGRSWANLNRQSDSASHRKLMPCLSSRAIHSGCRSDGLPRFYRPRRATSAALMP
jgi:hypothetical protein